MLAELDAPVVEEEYAGDVRYRVAVPTTRRGELEARAADLTRGEAVVRDLS
jgi:hypothetical protein